MMGNIPFLLPDIGEGVTEAEVVRWLVKEGEYVEEDQPVVEVQTDKAVVELPATNSGWINKIYFQIGELAKVGVALYEISTTEVKKTARPSSTRTKVLAAPTVRKAARIYGIDLQQVRGSGPNGRVLKSDLQRYLQDQQHEETEQQQLEKREIATLPVQSQSKQSVEQEVVEQPLSPIRKVIAERLSASVQQKPHVTHFAELDVTGIAEWRQRRLQEREKKKTTIASYFPILLRCLAKTLQQHPLFNSHFIEEQQTIRTFSSIHCGIATHTEQGLLVPVLRDLEKKEIREIAEEVKQLASRAREGNASVTELKGSTFTVSNAGSLGGDFATPIINPPEVAIIALHPIRQKPVVAPDGRLTIGWRMNVSLSFDHRILDGADAIAFTNTLETYTKDVTRLL